MNSLLKGFWRANIFHLMPKSYVSANDAKIYKNCHKTWLSTEKYDVFPLAYHHRVIGSRVLSYTYTHRHILSLVWISKIGQAIVLDAKEYKTKPSINEWCLALEKLSTLHNCCSERTKTSVDDLNKKNKIIIFNVCVLSLCSSLCCWKNIFIL